jgi:hypothetical protein
MKREAVMEDKTGKALVVGAGNDNNQAVTSVSMWGQ